MKIQGILLYFLNKENNIGITARKHYNTNQHITVVELS